MSDEPIGPPDGFSIGHWTDQVGVTGCTAVIAPPGSSGGVDVRGGGPGTRETDIIGPLAGTAEVSAVMLSGGSAFGLATADGAMRWLDERGRGYETPGGQVPIVPAAIIYDLIEGDAAARPDAAAGYAACEAATAAVPERGRVGAGTGAAVGKILGRERATPSGIGYAAARSGRGETVAALAVVNAFGDVVGADGRILAGARGPEGETVSTSATLAGTSEPPDWTRLEERNTTLVCVLTDGALDKPACTRVARMASGGVARAVDPVFSGVDGDVAFCLASGVQTGSPDGFAPLAIGTLAATVTAAAIRDSVTA
ncbi:MAG: peptidase DmpA [Solirubrobacterales bacterium]|jgi:L-aminopeptidase/D-esterase-like protein|nr:peptidase DmpA [Solirubrobacterales bacterium]